MLRISAFFHSITSEPQQVMVSWTYGLMGLVSESVKPDNSMTEQCGVRRITYVGDSVQYLEPS